MIAANKRFLKANLTQGVLEIQRNLVDLYIGNLLSVAGQASFIAGFAFSGIFGDPGNADDIKSEVLTYFYLIAFTISFVTSLYILSIVVITVMFGPTLALKGSTDDAVKYVATQMRETQIYIMKLALLDITALLVGACVFSWHIYAIPVASLTCFVYITIYYAMLIYGSHIYRVFNPLDMNAFLEPDAIGYTPDGRRMTGKEYQEEKAAKERERLSEALEATKLKVKGILWKRQSVEDGGVFTKYYAVLEKGRLDLYAKEKDYRENSNPVNSKPIKLWQYNIELDPRKYQQNVTGIASAFKSKLVGHEDFTYTDLMSGEYDLTMAAKNYKFGLVPKVVSELVVTTTHEFLAHDETTYKMWTEAFDSVVNAFDAIAASPSLEQTIRVGTADVELVVQAANNNK